MLTNAESGSECTCSDEADSAGTLLWQLDHDGDSSTPDRCSGMAYSTGYMNGYAPYAYDGIVSFAQAANYVVEATDSSSFDNGLLLDALRSNVTFEGVTGQVEFTNRKGDNQGDREVGVAYNIVNHDGADFQTLTYVGMWTVDSGLDYTDDDYSFIWPTDDGSKPDDKITLDPCPVNYYGIGGATCSMCPDGSYNSNSGNTYTIDDCVCSPGYYGTGGFDCSACAEGTYTADYGSEYSSACEKSLKVCLLVPSYRTSTGDYDSGGHNRLAGAIHAIKEINDKSDLFWDDLLPDTTIVYEWYNSGRSASTSMQMAIECVTNAFGGTKADVVLGPASSGPSMNANLILSNYDIPQISYSATSPSLSDVIEYPTFFRTPPSDAFQGLASADVIANVFGWDSVLVISGDDSYSSAGATAFISAASNALITTYQMPQVSLQPLWEDLTAAVSGIASSDVRVVFLMAQADTSGFILREAYAQGVFGADSGYVWFLTDAFTNNMGGVLSAMTNVNGTCPECDAASSKSPPAAMTEAECDAAMKGTVGMSQVSDFGEMSSIYSAWTTRFAAQTDTAGTDPSSGGECANGETTITGDASSMLTNAESGSECTCSDEADSAGTLLWQLDHDGDSSTPDRCSGMAYSTGYMNGYAPYAYDGIVSFAQAATAAGDGFDGVALQDALSSTSFEGVTGQIAFTGNDREVGVAYTVVNHDGTDFATLDSVGPWTVDTGLVPTDTSVTAATYPWVWSTTDGSKPLDKVTHLACPAGTYGSGGYDCTLGDDGKTGSACNCFVCPAGTYMPHTGADNSASCKKCPDHFFLMDDGVNGNLHDSLEDCSECASHEFSDLDGKGCSSENYNFIPKEYEMIVNVFTIISIFLSVVGAYLTFHFRENHVVKISQPFFLYIVCFGCAISVAANFMAGPTDEGMFDSGAAEWDYLNADLDYSMQSVFCNGFWWVHSTGFILSYSALIAKMFRIHAVMKAAKKLKAVRIKPMDVVKSILMFLAVDYVVLALWSITSPLEYKREPTDYSFGRPSASIGKCHSDAMGMYITVIMLIHLFLIIVGNVMAYVTRHIDNKLNEGRDIAICFFNNMQFMIIGVFILIVVKDNPGHSYLAKGLLICINDISLLAAVLGPKLWRIYGGGDDNNTFSMQTSMGTSGRTGTETSSGGDSQTMATSFDPLPSSPVPSGNKVAPAPS